jgi:hypothetical protein
LKELNVQGKKNEKISKTERTKGYVISKKESLKLMELLKIIHQD